MVIGRLIRGLFCSLLATSGCAVSGKKGDRRLFFENELRYYIQNLFSKKRRLSPFLPSAREKTVTGRETPLGPGDMLQFVPARLDIMIGCSE